MIPSQEGNHTRNWYHGHWDKLMNHIDIGKNQTRRHRELFVYMYKTSQLPLTAPTLNNMELYTSHIHMRSTAFMLPCLGWVLIELWNLKGSGKKRNWNEIPWNKWKRARGQGPTIYTGKTGLIFMEFGFWDVDWNVNPNNPDMYTS